MPTGFAALPPPGPAAPSGLSASIVDFFVRLAWADNADDEAGFVADTAAARTVEAQVRAEVRGQAAEGRVAGREASFASPGAARRAGPGATASPAS